MRRSRLPDDDHDWDDDDLMDRHEYELALGDLEVEDEDAGDGCVVSPEEAR
jgi:hypothetical protein